MSVLVIQFRKVQVNTALPRTIDHGTVVDFVKIFTKSGRAKAQTVEASGRLWQRSARTGGVCMKSSVLPNRRETSVPRAANMA